MTRPPLRSCLYIGNVMHMRMAPRRHGFRYRVCCAAIDLDELPLLEQQLRPLGLPLFGHNRRALARLDDTEYLGDSQLGLRARVVAWAANHGASIDDDARVLLITNLRQFGYVFNPISIFYITPSGSPAAQYAVVEVHNTFGERHRYLAAVGADASEHDKRLHVSPFMPMDQRYRMRLPAPGQRFNAGIDLLDDRSPFHATWSGRRHELTVRSLAWSLVRYPLAPLLVTIRIHRQALTLWRLRVPIFRKPPFREGHGTITEGDVG